MKTLVKTRVRHAFLITRFQEIFGKESIMKLITFCRRFFILYKCQTKIYRSFESSKLDTADLLTLGLEANSVWP